MRRAFGVCLPLRWWLFVVATLLLVFPTCLYWNTTWMEYGLRDDYSVTREAREEPGKEIRFCGSQARPIYGWLLQTTFKHIDHIRDLSWSRLGGSICLGFMAAGVCLVLVLLYSWSLTTAACVGAMFALVPSAQMVAGWSILWPYAYSALLSMAAFVAAENGFRQPPTARGKQFVLCILAMVLVVASAWTFQPNGLFYLVFIAVKAVRRGELVQQAPRFRLIQHLFLLGWAMLMAYALIRLAFALELLPISKRVAFEHDYFGKFVWFVKNPLPNALALLVLNDFQGRTSPWYQLMVGAVAVLLMVGGIQVTRRRGWREGLVWFAGIAVLGTGAYGINLMVSERWASYRTIYPLVGVVLIYVAASVEVLGETINVIKRFRVGLGLAVVVAAAFFARWQAYELIAVPQNKELRLVEQESRKLDLTRDQRVYIITPTPEIAPAPLLYTDEFGSLSTDSDWVPKEIMKLFFYEKYPKMPPCRSLDHMVSGFQSPPPGVYDVVIDLRGLRAMTN